MLDCQLCWRRCLGVLLPPTSPLTRASISGISASYQNARFYATAKPYKRPVGKKRKGPRTYPKNTTFADNSGQRSRPPPFGGSRPPPLGGSRPPPFGGSRPPPFGGSRPPPFGGSRPPPFGGRNDSRPGAFVSRVSNFAPRKYEPRFGEIKAQDRQAFRSSSSPGGRPPSSNYSAPPPRQREDRDFSRGYSSPAPAHREYRKSYDDVPRLARTDPAKLASQIRERLSNSPESRDAALETVRNYTSHGDVDTTAAWNALIAHGLAIGDVAGAFRTFNEMKKRGKVPNEYTYTTLISGLAEPQNALYPSTLPRALATYNTLKENSAKGNMGVKLNIKHTNAMLKVCSRTGALDTMWEVVGSLPERGVAAADAMTYTTFLNGLRTLAAPLVTEPVAAAMDWSDEGIAVSSPRPKTIRSTAPEDIVEDAKRLWAGLLTRWTKGDFILDEQLISAMGRLLLSSPRDTDLHSVFDMIHTIYKIPNFFLESTAEAKEAEDAAIESATSAYKPLVAPRASNSTLSLLIETAAQLRAPIAVGDSYVKYFTETLHVQMDVENYHSYLRLLRMFREAKLATELIEKMAAPFLPKPTAKEVEDASSLPTESPAAKKSVAHSSSPIISSPPTTKAFMLALSACRRKGGRVAFYPSALRILDIFDKMPLPPPPHGNNVHQRPYITTDIPKVYTAFLDLALFHGDPQTLKHALKRVTTIPTERSGAVPALPVLLSKKSTRTDDVMYFAKTILQLAQTLLHGSDAGWGHGERTALKENFEMLREMVNNGWNLSDGKGEGSVPVWKEAATWGEARAGPIREEPVHLTKSEKLALKEKKREAWKLKMATNNAAFVAGLKRGKDAGAAGGEKEHGEAAEDWAPSSARDRGAKQFSRPLNGGAQEAYVARSRILAEVGKSREEWGERRPAYTPRSSEGRSWPRESAPREERPRREYAPRGGEERRQSSSFDRPSRDSRGGDRESPRSFDRPRGGDRERPSFDRPSRDSRGGDRDRPSSSSFDRRAPPPAEKHPLAGGSAGPSSWGTGRPQRTFASAPSSSYTRDRDSGDKYFSR